MKNDLSTLKEKCEKMILHGDDKVKILSYIDMYKLNQPQSFEVLSFIDETFTSLQLAKQAKSNYFNQTILGLALLLLGLFITVGTYIIGTSKFMLALGLILSGSWIMKEGYKKYKLPLEEHLPRHQRIRKKKFSKF